MKNRAGNTRRMIDDAAAISDARCGHEKPRISMDDLKHADL